MVNLFELSHVICYLLYSGWAICPVTINNGIKMTQQSREKLFKEVKKRYLKADYKAKQEILNEFCQNTGYHRKHAIRILSISYSRVSADRRKKRSFTYSTYFFQLVIKIWELLEYPCGKRLQPQLLPIGESLERNHEIEPLEPYTKQQLSAIGAKTLDRRLKRERIIRRLKKNRGTTRHGSLLKSSIPIRITNWDARRIGFMEMDTVVHNGGDRPFGGICLQPGYAGNRHRMERAGRGIGQGRAGHCRCHR